MGCDRTPPAARRTLLLLALAISACTETGARPTGTVQAADSADQMLEGAELVITRDGVRQSRVNADTAYFYEASQTAALRRVRVVFFTRDGEETTTLTAATGTYYWRDGSMEARGNVLVVSLDGRRLRTEVLRYTSADRTIATDQPFTFDGPGEHLEGNSFRSDPDFRNVVTERPRGTAKDGLVIPGQ